MTFQQLQYLLEVRQTKSISKAAANLFVSNSSVSASISTLEDEMGFPIFTRSQKGLVPTEKGLQILSRAERICRIYDEMNDVKNNNLTEFKASFRSYPPFARAFARLVEENHHRSDILFRTVTLLRDDMIKKVASQELELSIISYFAPRVRLLEAKLAKAGLEHRVLKTVPAAVQVGPGHRLYNAKSITPAELENDTIVDSATKPLVNSDFLHGVMEFKPEKVILCDNSASSELIHRGLAYTITIMPTEEIRNVSPCRFIPMLGVDFQLILVTNPERPLSPEGNRFLELLDEELDNI